MKTLLSLLAALLPAPAVLAAGNVALESKIFVEKTVQDAHGAPRIVLQPPALVVPGEQLVFVLDYSNRGNAPATNFTVTNPLPHDITFTDAADAGAELSVDGGKSWGQLAVLTVPGSDGKRRAARPTDVTHIRWVLKQPVAVGESGRLTFRGTVR
jgi:uncharacterized repeat protein (TIGR01451 family)